MNRAFKVAITLAAAALAWGCKQSSPQIQEIARDIPGYGWATPPSMPVADPYGTPPPVTPDSKSGGGVGGSGNAGVDPVR